MSLYYCHYEYQVDDAKTGERYRERGYIEFETDSYPTKEEVKSIILSEFEWKRNKNIKKNITQIYEPEKIY